ncbi:MAG: hypothetical protein M3R47_02190, partial [Chloroflexota bacterium]|nr:hypothetical protein [Chloroflexota bacterium]
PSNFKLKVKNTAGWLPWVIGGLAGMMLILVVGSVLTFGLLRRNSNVTSTPTPTLRPLFTQTPLLQPEITSILPATTATPQIILPIAPTYTPWPTNTLIP